ncbi:ribosomal protein L22/L17 [Flagelloscypha sp. PMI_526]|nr:ribosomal protein L22/L17 [Flagelloscypha sp. PMI_526]
MLICRRTLCLRQVSRTLPARVTVAARSRRAYATSPPESENDSNKWLRDTFKTGLSQDTPSQAHSLGGIFEDFEDPAPTSEEKTPQKKSKSKKTSKKATVTESTEPSLSELITPAGPAIEASKLAALPIHKVKRTTPKVRVRRTEFHGKTDWLTQSVLKVNPITRLIAGKPIDWAILQMRFNQKSKSQDIEELLVKVKADVQRARPSLVPSLVVHQIWVAKGPFIQPRIDFKGRGRVGRIRTRTCRVFVVLAPGKTIEEKKEEKRRKQLKRIVSAAIVREDVPLRNMGGVYRW